MLTDITDRIIGAMLGMAVGDALGAPLAGAKQGSIRAAFGEVRDFADPEPLLGREKIYRWRKPGLYGCATQQALAVCDSLIEDGRLEPEKLAERMARLSRGAEFHFGAWRGAGGDIRAPLTDLRQGKSWTDSGRDTAGAGAAARAVPIALYYAGRRGDMLDAAARATLITHRGPAAAAAAGAVACLVGLCLAADDVSEPVSRRLLISDTAAGCREFENLLAARYSLLLPDGYENSIHHFSDTLSGIAERFGDPHDSVSEWIAQNAASLTGAQITRPTANVALAAVVYAIYVAALRADDFEAALLLAANSGGSTDVVCSIAGAAAGALHGASGIPERWMKNLANRKQLKARAEALAAKKRHISGLEDLYEMEYGLTKREHEERLARMRKAGAEFPEKKKQHKPAAQSVVPQHDKYDAKQHRRRMKKFKKWASSLQGDSSEDD